MTPTREDSTYYNEIMEDIIYEGGQDYDDDWTQSKDGHGQYTQGLEDTDDHDNQGKEDIDGHNKQGEDEDGVDIEEDQLFQDELKQQANAQRRQSIHAGAISIFGSQSKHGNKPFTLTHCWTMMCECPKFKEKYATQKRGGGGGVAKPSEGENMPRGKTNSQVDDKHDAETIDLQENLKGFMTQNKVREERKDHEKEEQMNTYFDIQSKKLDIKENLQSKKIEIEETIA
ncbi:Receptor-like protein kinase HSL1 [Hordeum vulgare]|nr:Receptor-like protein kinase HSL1 [Hordeum vulgare]